MQKPTVEEMREAEGMVVAQGNQEEDVFTDSAYWISKGLARKLVGNSCWFFLINYTNYLLLPGPILPRRVRFGPQQRDLHVLRLHDLPGEGGEGGEEARQEIVGAKWKLIIAVEEESAGTDGGGAA